MSTVEQEFGLSADDAEHLIGSLLNSNVIDIFCYALYTMIFWATLRQIGKRIQPIFKLSSSSHQSSAVNGLYSVSC